jgi:hypothetical protein
MLPPALVYSSVLFAGVSILSYLCTEIVNANDNLNSGPALRLVFLQRAGPEEKVPM